MILARSKGHRVKSGRRVGQSGSDRVREVCMQRSKPNILVTGTPGTGKTTTCQQVVEAIGFVHINVGDWVKEQELHSGWDNEHDCYVIDEDKVDIRACTYSRKWCMANISHLAWIAAWGHASLVLQVCDALEDVLATGGTVVDYHGCDFFPER